MFESYLNSFYSPVCGKNYNVDILEKKDGQIFSGKLVLKETKEIYHIKDFVPRFVDDAAYTQSFGFQWNIHAKSQLDSSTKLPISEKRLFSVTDWSTNLSGQKILEAGSGAGRFTEILVKTGAIVHSFDYSSAVDANFSNNGHNPNLIIFQADMFRLPLQSQYFDKVLCLGVLQHTPHPSRAFVCLSNLVKPGGQLVIDIYAKRLRSLIQWKYLLRPLTRKLSNQFLYNVVSKLTPVFIPLIQTSKAALGKYGSRVFPVVEYSELGLPESVNEDWAILDTYDMYAPLHDHPQSISTVRKWFVDNGFEDISVVYGHNGIIGKGIKMGLPRD